MNVRVLDGQLINRNVLKVILAVIAFLLMFCVVRTVKAAVTENDEASRVFTCKMVQVEENDTLWDIAQVYYTDEYADICTYINEIMKTNNMISDMIYADEYLLIPYYE